jgi:hypothetical protein
MPESRSLNYPQVRSVEGLANVTMMRRVIRTFGEIARPARVRRHPAAPAVARV